MENFDTREDSAPKEERNQRNQDNGNLNNPDGRLIRGGIEMDLHKVNQPEILDI